MSFQDIIDNWRKTGRTAHAEHVSVALKVFRLQHVQVFINLDTDKQITQSKRQELLEQLLTAAAYYDVVVSRIVSFCQAHQCLGPPRGTAQRASLGHVEERRKTEKTLASAALPTSGLTRRRRSSALVIDKILRCTLPEQCDLLHGIPLSKYQIWSFYHPLSLDDPFRGIVQRHHELVRKLGLGHVDPSSELLLWAHRLQPEQVAHIPTTFDAELNEYFRPVGKTEPLSGSGGLPEVVHPPVNGDQLSHSMERVLP